MKNIREWKDPWKKLEPDSRVNQKIQKEKRIFNKQRFKMKQDATQNILVTCHKSLFLLPGLFRSFNIQLSIPIRESDFLKRIAVAFPELKLEEP